MPTLRERLYDRLRKRPYPLFVFDGGCTLPAAAIWTGARAWTRAFRAAGVQPGDRFVLALPPSAAFVQALVAALWEGLTVVPVAPESDLSGVMETVDGRWAAALTGDADQGVFIPEDCSGPDPERVVCARVTHLAPTPEACLLLKTSGSTGLGRWVALSESAVLANLDTHLPLLDLHEAETRLLSVLPWHHVFGLSFDLLAGIFAGVEIIRDPHAGRNTEALLALAAKFEPTWMNLVPLTVRRLGATAEGTALLQSLDGGIVGGAAVEFASLELLRTTKLRVGYGQTEAAPGVSLGAPGVWPVAGYLGQAVGCELQVDPDGALAFRGPNACLGEWTPHVGLTVLEESRWHTTGDLVEHLDDGALRFLGRSDDGFKLANGTRVEAGFWETALKTRFPEQLQEALLYSPDGESLSLLLTATTLPREDELRAALGTLGPRLGSVQRLDTERWVRTPKGTVNRHATLAALQTPSLALGPDQHLTCEQLEAFASTDQPRATLTPTARAAMAQSHGWLRTLQGKETAIYGTTTGFGPFVRFGAGDRGGYGQGAALIAHLGAGFGEDAPACVVKTAMAIRAQNVAQGYSAVRPEVVEAYLGLLAAGVTPSVPVIGSVGASGDLVPLAHIAHTLAERLPLEGRDALALTNGTSFLTAYAALATARAERLVRHAEILTGWAYRLLGCRAAALDDRLHTARGHDGQRESARHIRAEAERFGPFEDKNRPLQEIYSLRCAPQVLGACRENLSHARRLIETEINGVSDNPLFFDGPSVVHGGNFHGQQVAFAADALNAALVQVGVLAERQIDALVTPSRTNDHAPLLLSWEPGPQSGVAGAQLTATALVAELRAHGGPAATLSIPTNGGNQDVVSMGTLAARLAYGQTERLSGVLAVLALTLWQLAHLRARDGLAIEAIHPPAGLPEIAPIVTDRPLREELRQLALHFLD